MANEMELRKLESRVQLHYKNKSRRLEEEERQAEINAGRIGYTKKERETNQYWERLFVKSLSKFQRSRITKDSRGELSDWDVSIKHTEEVLRAEATAYNAEWRTNVLSMFALAHDLGKAMSNTGTELSMHVLYNGFLLLIEAGRKLGIPTLLKDTIAIIIGDDPEHVIPVFMSLASINKDTKKLETGLLEHYCDDDKRFDADFKAVIIEWLAMHGYTPDPNNDGQFLNKESGVTLDNKGFNKLKVDNNLYGYLNESALSFKESPSMTM